ncbi:MAG: YgiQ family radical SAM protein [archaeon]
MNYDIIFVSGEIFFDHPLSGIALLKRLLEKNGYSVGVIAEPKSADEVAQLGRPNLFFGVSAGSIDSMVRNYTPMKRLRKDDRNLDYNETVPDRATIVYSNWIKQKFKDTVIVLGGVEATLRRFVHYDYWDNKLRRPLLFDSKTDILAYGTAEKQILEIAKRLKNKKALTGIPGTCIISKEVPEGFVKLPSLDTIYESKERFCDMQNLLDNNKNLAQKIDNRYVLQYAAPTYTSKDIDEYYELPFTRQVPVEHLRGFEFSIVTHRGCIGECNFCSLKYTQGNKIISRSEESILREIERITKMPHFKGNIDDLGGPSANMYGMDCNKCNRSCIDCVNLDRTNKRLINLLRKVRTVPGVKKVFVRSGVRYDLASCEYIQELAQHHVSGKLKIAPEHVSKNVLRAMNKDKGDFRKFVDDFNKAGTRNELAFYFMTAHPGSSMKEAEELARAVKKLRNAEAVQIFIPTPMTVSTCMYYTGLDPVTKKKIYVPNTYSEKKGQKRIVFSGNDEE